MLTAMTSTTTPRPPLRRTVGAARRWLRERIETLRWRLQGCPALAPPHIKRAVLLRHLRANGLRVFVETGTLYGDTLAYLRPWCAEMHSIELSQELFEKASERFAGDPKIHVWHGDSGNVMPEVLKVISQPALFWLDGHYSGEGTARGVKDTPICRELHHISGHPLLGEHLVIIDDARCFNGQNDYPDLNELQQLALTLGFTEIKTGCDCIILR